MKPQLLAVPLIFAVLVACSGKPAADTAPVSSTGPSVSGTTGQAQEASWLALDAEVGKYAPDIDLYGHSPISAALKQLLGERYATFTTNMQVGGPLSKAPDGELYITGNKPHEGGSEQAYLLIDPAARRLEVGLRTAGRLTTYRSPGAPLAKPRDVQILLENAADMPAASTTTH